MKRLEAYFYDTLEEYKIMYNDAEKRPGLDYIFNDAYLIPEVVRRTPLVVSAVIQGFPGS